MAEERELGLRGWISGGKPKKGSEAGQEKTMELDTNRIAVLPFANMSPDPNDSYLADGITDEVISTVSGISGLSVISRTSVMGYKGTTKKIEEIGRELKVGSILEGSFRKAGNKIRVTTQLIDVPGDKHLWTQSYDRELDDVFAVQSDIARQVADYLRVKVLPHEESRLVRGPTESSEAFVFYLKGRSFWKERTKESLEKAVGYFRKAIEKDADFALAYAGIADSYTIFLDRGYKSGKDAVDFALVNARRALEIDGSLAEAHLAMGGVYQHTYEWASAEDEFKTAIKLNPSLSQAHHWLGVQYDIFHRWDMAVVEYTKALELDPLSPFLRGMASYSMVMAGKVDEGMKMAEEVVFEHPDQYWGHLGLSLACLKRSQNDRAVDEARKGFQVGGGEPWPASFYVYVLKATGRSDEARETADRYLITDGTRGWNPTQLAMVYLSIDDRERAFELLDEAYRRSDPALMYLGWPPIFDSVNSDPRYRELAKKVKLG